MTKVRRFKFLREGLKSQHDGYQWEIGKWHKTECLELCHGFNCSRRIIDAMSYVQGEVLAEVEVKEKHFDGDDKSTHKNMKIIRAWKWQKNDSVALSIFAAEMVLKNFESVFPADDRPHKAIDAAKKYLENPTEENRSAAISASWSAISASWSASSAARSAAWSAAESAARSARSAAWSAAISASWSAISASWSAISASWSASSAASSAAESARSAAESAARSAAESAAESARSARSAALDEIEAWILRHLDEMEVI